MRKPQPGDIKITSDGINHRAEVFAISGQWEPLRCVCYACLTVQPGKPVKGVFTVESIFLDLLSPKEKNDLQLTGLQLPEDSAE